ncbi:MAG: NUDIX domain-containing protein, partial [Candidatus Kariarchaeaceae archaeon]
MSTIANPPIKSASIILQNTDGKVLLCKRSHTVSFFPTFWVFPGGKIESPLPENWTGTEPEVVETILQELYEEVGIVPGRTESIDSGNRSQPYYSHDYEPDIKKVFLEKMVYIGKKRTPPFRTKTYDAAYYFINDEIIDSTNPIVDGSELVESIWISPQDAINNWEKWEMRIPPPILHILRTLADYPEQIEIKTLVETELPIGLQTRVEFSPGFELIPFESTTIPPFNYTNLVLVTSESDCLIVDPGANSNEESHFKEI